MTALDKFIYKVLGCFLRIFHINISDSARNNFVQFIKFSLVGVSNTIIGYLLNIGTLLILKPYRISADYYIANLAAFFLSVLWSFYWNNKYVFKAEGNRNLLAALLRMYAAYAFSGIVINNVLSYVWVDLLGISKYIAPIINLTISVPINFVLNKLWAFK